MATKRVGKDGENLKKGKRGAIWEREDQELFANYEHCIFL